MEYFRFGVRLALICFLIGTIILIFFAVTLSTRVALLAYQFTITALIINWIYAAILLFHLLRQRLALQTLFKTLGVMTINIPIGIFYAWLMVIFLSYARITVKNKTGQDLTSVELMGCDSKKQINELKKNEETTVWIKITKDCGLSIHYRIDDRDRSNVIGNLTPGPDAIIRYELKK
jgi:hypothetical protein